MKKSDLVAGKHVVKYRDGRFRFVDENRSLSNAENKLALSLLNYNEHLKYLGDDNNDFDIVAVYELKEVWKREEPTITEDEKAILRNLPAGYKWIAQDRDGRLFVYPGKPSKAVNAWGSTLGYTFLGSFNHLFKMVKWEDDEPWKIEDLLKLDVKKDG